MATLKQELVRVGVIFGLGLIALTACAPTAISPETQNVALSPSVSAPEVSALTKQVVLPPVQESVESVSEVKFIFLSDEEKANLLKAHIFAYPEISHLTPRETLKMNVGNKRLTVFNFDNQNLSFDNFKNVIGFFANLPSSNLDVNNQRLIKYSGYYSDSNMSLSFYLEKPEREECVWFVVPKDVPAPEWAGNEDGARAIKFSKKTSYAFVRNFDEKLTIGDVVLTPQEAFAKNVLTEACQSNVSIRYRANENVEFNGQEIVCNSFPFAMLMKARGATIEQYTQKFSNIYFYPNQNERFSVYLLNQEEWNELPVIRDLLSKR